MIDATAMDASFAKVRDVLTNRAASFSDNELVVMRRHHLAHQIALVKFVMVTGKPMSGSEMLRRNAIEACDLIEAEAKRRGLTLPDYTPDELVDLVRFEGGQFVFPDRVFA